MTPKLETLGPNNNRVTVGAVTILFSYETAVAYTIPQMNWIIDPTKYRRTTSRHINSSIPKEWQVVAADRESFEAGLEKALAGYKPDGVLFEAEDLYQ